MKKEAMIGLALLGLSTFAFSRPVRRHIGQRDNWTCTEEGCEKSFRNGWLVEANHEVPAFEGGHNRASNGKIKCLEHHYEFHKRRGDTGAARLIWWRIQNTEGGHTKSWLENRHRKK